MPLIKLEFGHDPLFSVGFHPDKPEFVLGFASGHVKAYQYDPEQENSETAAEPSVLWSTKRHKSSCRAISYSQDGQAVFTAGSDKVIKKACSKTGKVKAKCTTDAPASTICVNENFLAVGDDEGQVGVYDMDTLGRKYQCDAIHGESINAIFPLEHKNKYTFVVGGSSLVVRVDARKGVMSTSEDQEDEVLSGCLASDEQCAFGMAEGVLTLWNSVGLTDQQSRIRLAKDSVDCVIAGQEDGTVVAGTGEGTVFEVDVKSGKILNKRTHSDEDVSFLDWDYEYRLATGSMSLLVLWNKHEVDQPAAPVSKKAKRKLKTAQEKTKKPKFDDL